MTVSLPNFPDHSPEIHKDGQGAERVSLSSATLEGRRMMSRREVFSSIAAAPLVGIGIPAAAVGVGALSLPVALAVADDPVFDLITRHKIVWDAFGDTCKVTDEVAAQQEGRVITARDLEIHEEANEAEKEVFYELISTPPRTAAGVLAFIKYLQPIFYDYDHVDTALETLMKSPALADA